MLNGVLQLHDIRDVEAFCAAIVRRTKLDLNAQDHEALLTYLVEEAWLLSTRYERGDPSYPPRFSVIAHTTLRNRITDWLRREKEDRRYPTRYTLTPLHDQLDHPELTRPLDDPAHRHPLELRLHRNRDRTNDRPYPHLGQRTTRAAA